MKRHWGSALLVGAAAAVGVALATPAGAVGGSCTSWYNKTAISGAPDAYRVGASCSSINSDTKPRGVLIVGYGHVDEFTQWFTRTGTSYYSAYRQMPAAYFDGTKVELAPR